MGSMAIAAILMTGCAETPISAEEAEPTASTAVETPSATPEPKRTADPNDQACVRFAEAHNRLADLLHGGKGDLTVEAWRQAQDDEVTLLDEHSLAAEGDIAERMKAAVEIIPADPVDMSGPYDWKLGVAYNEAIAEVYTACKADGIAYGMKEIPLAPEMLRQ